MKSFLYSPVTDEEGSEDGRALLPSEKPLPPRRAYSIVFKALTVTGLILLWLLSLFAAASFGRSMDQPAPGHLRETSAYSPIHERFQIPIITKQVDKSLWPNASNPEHIYRLPPSPEVDAAWNRIAEVGYFPVSLEEAAKSHKDPSMVVITPESWELGLDEFGNGYSFGNIDVFHELHCLNVLRKGLVTNFNYYLGRKYGFHVPALYEFHLNHCLDIVRQALMCHADLEVATHVWREEQDPPFPDLGIYRTCKDFDALLEWQTANMIPDIGPKWDAFKKPPGARAYPGPWGMPEAGVDGVYEKDGVLIRPLPGLENVEYCMGVQKA